MEALQIFICGPVDVKKDVELVMHEVTRINGCIMRYPGISLNIHHWSIYEDGIRSQDSIYDRLRKVDLAIFIFHRKCGYFTRKEFDIVLKQFMETGKPEIKVWFEYVPDEFSKDPGLDYKELLEFKKILATIPPNGLIYSTYRSDAKIAKPFASNEDYPSIEILCWQNLFPFVFRSKGLFNAVLTDRTKIPCQEYINQDIVRNHWRERSKRTGIGPIISGRYKKDEITLQNASNELVLFGLDRTKNYIAGKRIIELGSGMGRFTLPLLDLAKSLTIVDMSPDMTKLLKDRLKKRWNELTYIESFVEDLPHFEKEFECAFSCLLFIHIVTEDNLKRAIQKIKQIAKTIIIFEHTDLSAQKESSNFTRIWSHANYERLFHPEFREITSYKYDFLGDKLELMIFQKIEYTEKPYRPEHFVQKTASILKEALSISSTVVPLQWKEWYDPFSLGKLLVNYESLMGSEEFLSWEFTRNKLIVIANDKGKYYLPKELVPYEDELRANVISDIEKKKDFRPVDEIKARVLKILPREVNPIDTLPNLLEVHLAPMTYFQYLIMKKAINERYIYLREKYTAKKHLSLESISNLETTNIGGCGLFCLTTDGFIILTLRKMVAEHPGVISYSASGSMNWLFPGSDETKEANPFLTIMREGHEELGVLIDIEKVTLYAIGIDLASMFVQFSFYINIQMDANSILKHWKKAQARYEGDAFAIPFTPKEIVKILSKYSMEPSAAATLYQLSSKRFGADVMKSQLKKAFED